MSATLRQIQKRIDKTSIKLRGNLARMRTTVQRVKEFGDAIGRMREKFPDIQKGSGK